MSLSYALQLNELNPKLSPFLLSNEHLTRMSQKIGDDGPSSHTEVSRSLHAHDPHHDKIAPYTNGGSRSCCLLDHPVFLRCPRCYCKVRFPATPTILIASTLIDSFPAFCHQYNTICQRPSKPLKSPRRYHYMKSFLAPSEYGKHVG